MERSVSLQIKRSDESINSNQTNEEGEPQNYMFADMRSAVNIPPGYDILDYIYSLPDAQQTKAFDKIQDIETKAMAEQVPQPGLVRLMEYLDSKQIAKGICTRNFEYVFKYPSSQDSLFNVCQTVHP